jgi:hypothetical protein
MTNNPLQTEFCGMRLASPIVLLSGCVGFGEEYTRVEGFSKPRAARASATRLIVCTKPRTAC